MAGRKQTFQIIASGISPEDKTIWFHCASLGEFEQGVPVMESLRTTHPDHKIIVSFFSPSGYENKKNTPLADVVIYLPIDTKSNAKKFIKTIHPSLVLFVKYEFWPNYLLELKRQNIKTLLISGVFREEQLFFKFYGGFMRKALDSFDQFFLQNQASKELLASIGFTNTSVSGDTRFDRVSLSKNLNEDVDYIKEFLSEKDCLIAGSSWGGDHKMIVNYINTSNSELKYIIAPHEIHREEIETLKSSINKKTVLFSELNNENIKTASVIIVDNIGTLSKLYKYATLAYIGGGFNGEGKLHNTLEAAVFGLPIIIGKYYGKFPEAVSMIGNGGMFSVNNAESLKNKIDELIRDKEKLQKTGALNSSFIKKKIGATQSILTNLK